MVPWGSATGKGGVGVVATVTFTEPVDLPITVRGWNPSGGETDNLSPEDDLGRMITAAVPRSARTHVSVETVYVSFVGDPGVYAAARLV